MKKLFLYFFISSSFVIWFSGCKTNDAELEKALQFAGENRIELEKVLAFYSYREEDRLKYKAACYLIEQMPSFYSLQDTYLEKIKSELYPLALNTHRSAKDIFIALELKYGKLQPGKYHKVYDSHVITGNYLIQNIDLAFTIWEESRWRKNISFDLFCTEILPYRIADEPLCDWRRSYYENFSHILDSLPSDSDMENIRNLIQTEAFKQYWLYEDELPLPHLGAEILLNNRFGGERDKNDFITYIYRALGILP